MKQRRPTTYEMLRDQVRAMRLADSQPSDEERADWAYGNAKLANEAVTREMATEAVEKRNKGRCEA